jgi:hypothetical protein
VSLFVTCKFTHSGIDDGSAKMPMALQTVKIPKANGWRMVSDTTTNRETAADHGISLCDCCVVVGSMLFMSSKVKTLELLKKSGG